MERWRPLWTGFLEAVALVTLAFGRTSKKEPGHLGSFLRLVRPAWALSCGCKSRREEVIPTEANRNCERATDRGKEAGSEAAGRWTRSRYEASANGASGPQRPRSLDDQGPADVDLPIAR